MKLKLSRKTRNRLGAGLLVLLTSWGSFVKGKDTKPDFHEFPPEVQASITKSAGQFERYVKTAVDAMKKGDFALVQRELETMEQLAHGLRGYPGTDALNDQLVVYREAIVAIQPIFSVSVDEQKAQKKRVDLMAHKHFREVRDNLVISYGHIHNILNNLITTIRNNRNDANKEFLAGAAFAGLDFIEEQRKRIRRIGEQVKNQPSPDAAQANLEQEILDYLVQSLEKLAHYEADLREFAS